LAALLLLPDLGAAQVPPDERYLVFDTDHFRVVFPEGFETFARRASASAEWAYAALSEHFIDPPRGRIALVISDNADWLNASATPVPANRVTLIATPGIGERQLNYYTDWLALTLVHELTHIFHLDRAAGIWSIGRALFGRSPIFFPAFYQPHWVIEGLATYYESRLTGAGRAYGSYFDMLLSSAAVEGEFLAVDQADGLVPKWPAGQAPYAYGGLYFRSLAESHGDSAIVAFTRRGAARLPYTLNWASRPHFGNTLSARWDAWRLAFEASARARADSVGALGTTVGERLSGFAWNIPTPRYSPDGRYLAFDFVSPRDDPATVVLDAVSGRVVRRVRRNSAGGNTWARDGSTLYTQQLEFADRYRIFSELYALDVTRGGEHRLTVKGRITQANLEPAGRTLVAVQLGEGSNRLVLLDLETGEISQLTEFAPGVNWGRPRWAPDGALIAAERWVEGRILDLVVLDRAGELISQVTRDAAVDVAPAWSPDGRYLLWAADREGAFDIYAVKWSEVAPESGDTTPGVWRVTRTLGGAMDPDVSPDGRWLAYVAQHPEGFRVERIPFDPESWLPAGPSRRRLRRTPEPPSSGAAAVDAPVRPYSPFPSLWPQSWLPFIASGSEALGTFIGATVFGTDDVRRHAYAILAGWRTGVSDVEARGAYVYSALGDPIVQISVSQDWSSVWVRAPDGEYVRLIEREREFRLAATFARPRARSYLSLTPALGVERFRYFTTDPRYTLEDPTYTDVVGSVWLGFSSARRYPRSVGPEKGLLALIGFSHARPADDLECWRVTGEAELRAYASFPVLGHANHGLAGRVAVGASDASDGYQRGAEILELGGVPGRALDLGMGLTLGGGSRYHLRGFTEEIQIGDRIAAASLEYRFPLALIGRGHGLWPVVLDRISASVFLDAGSAWWNGEAMHVLASAGGELSSDVGLGYHLSYRFRIGLARQVAVPVGGRERWSGYVSTGVAF